MKRLARALDRLRESDLPVVIEGETGAGKEHVARLLHADSRRAAGPFAVVSCPSLPDDLFEAELFGARAGAYTGSEADRAGILERARGGTVLLDGIAELPAAAQAKLLRVLASGKARPLGSEAEVEIDVRFLFTAARPLEEEVKSGRLRPDLFHRLHVVTVRVPPLRERFEDFPELVRQLLEAAGGEPAARTPVPVIDRRVVEELRRRPWPGNVRELRNVLERLRMESPERIDLEALARVSGHAGAEGFFPGNLLHAEPLDSLQRRLERDYIAYHFRRLGFDTGKLCAFVGLSRRQLYRRCGRLGISLRGIKEAAPS
jgi:DNA-binding NtrC family response regulator